MLPTRRTATTPSIFLLPAVALAQFMLVLDAAIVNVALPSIRDDLGFSTSGLQWVVNAYTLAFGGFLLLGGRAGDLFGHRRLFLGALVGFTLASLACGFAESSEVLVAARSLQGLSAAVLSPATLSILTSSFQEPSARRRALSVWAAAAVGGGSAGALIGGVLTEVLSWRWIFFVNVPVGIALLTVAVVVFPADLARKGRRQLDIAGALAVTAGLVALVWGAIRAGDDGWGSWTALGAFTASLVLLALFVGIEGRLAKAPLLPLHVIHQRSLVAANILILMSFMVMFATWFLLSLYLQGVRDQSPIDVGLLFIPVSVGAIAGTQISFRLVSRVSARPLIVIGTLVGASGLVWLAQLSKDAHLAWVVLPAAIVMAGFGIAYGPITMAATSGLPTELSGLASGLMNTAQQVGGALGIAILVTIATSESSDPLMTDFDRAFTVGAAIFAATALVSLLALPRINRVHGQPTVASAA